MNTSPLQDEINQYNKVMNLDRKNSSLMGAMDFMRSNKQDCPSQKSS